MQIKGARRSALYLGVIFFVAIFLIPIIWMFGTSLMFPIDYESTTPHLFSSNPTLIHYAEIWRSGVALRIWNSIIVTFGTTVLALAAAAGAAYGLARYKFPAKLDVFFLAFVLIVKLMPPIVVAVPLFQLLRDVALLDTRTGLVLANQIFALPFAIWMLLSYFRDIPVDVEEAAALDGAAPIRRLRTIVLPMALPGIFTAGVFVTVISWNEYLFALLFLQNPQRFTLPLYIASFLTEDEIRWGDLMAIGVISSLPIICAAAFFQRNLLRGFASIEK